MNGTYPILLTPETFFVTPRDLIHRIRVAQIRRRLVVAPRCHWIFVHAPPMPEGIRELVHCEHELALCSAAFLHTGVEGLGLDGRGVGGGLGEVGDCQTGIGRCAPAVPLVGYWYKQCCLG